MAVTTPPRGQARRPDRRLAALLAMDMVGSSTAMEQDEAGTLDRLNTLHRDIIAPRIDEGGGRIFKTLGDGYLAEFTSAIDALDAAIDIQNAISTNHEAKADPRAGTPAIIFRIAIHVGDVHVRDGDLQGDSVNIVARLEHVAAPGEICLSRQAHDNVSAQRRYGFQPLGPQTLRNFNRPIDAFCLDPANLDAPVASAPPSSAPPSAPPSALERVIGRQGAALAQRGRGIWLLLGAGLIAAAMASSMLDAVAPDDQASPSVQTPGAATDGAASQTPPTLEPNAGRQAQTGQSRREPGGAEQDAVPVAPLGSGTPVPEDQAVRPRPLSRDGPARSAAPDQTAGSDRPSSETSPSEQQEGDPLAIDLQPADAATSNRPASGATASGRSSSEPTELDEAPRGQVPDAGSPPARLGW